MPRLQSTPALQEFPQLSRLHFFSTQNQGLVADYLAHLRARHDAPTMQEGTSARSKLRGPHARGAAGRSLCGPDTDHAWRY